MTTTLILALFCGVPENKWGHISLHLAYLLKAKKNLGRGFGPLFAAAANVIKRWVICLFILNDIFRNAIKMGREKRRLLLSIELQYDEDLIGTELPKFQIKKCG